MKGLRAKRIRTVKEGTLIATVDIGATTNTGYCTTVDGRDIKVFKFGNTREGFEKFWRMVTAARSRFGCDEVIVGYESTGPYAEPLVHYLLGKPVKLVQVNPLHVKRLKEVNDNSPGKTDEKDPRVIADVIKLGRALSIVVPEGHAACLRRLNNARERHAGERAALLNQLQQLVFLIFPEIKTVIKQARGKTFRFILKEYTTPDRIGALDTTVLGRELRACSRGRFGVKDAELLIRCARETVGIKEGVAGIVVDIRHIVAQLEVIDRFMTEIESDMALTVERIPSSARLLSIKGLGVVTVAGLIGEVGDFTKFRTRSEIIKLAGLDLFEISSGKKRGQRRITKRGRSLMRKILYFAALPMVGTKGIMHDYYTRLTGRGMLRMKALVAVMRKLLGLIHALIRDDCTYVENYGRVIKKAA